MSPRKRPRLYISGPITKGDGPWNFYQACSTQRDTMRDGFAVLNPMLSMMYPSSHQISWQSWIDSDLEWIAVADAIYRLPGESRGADIETGFAGQLGIPVFTDYDSLLNWQAEWQKQHVSTERAA